MKYYIERDDKNDFVCQARSAGEAIVMVWFAEKETPLSKYRIHQGQQQKSKTVSAAEAYWVLSLELRPALTAVLQETCDEFEFVKYCQNVLEISSHFEDQK
jgi:hypothetical protein